MFHSKEDVDRHVDEVFRNIRSEYQRNSKCYQFAKLYYKFKDYKSAIKYINRYILTTTNSAAAHRLLGECYLGVNLKVKAIDSFKASLELNGSQNDLILKICTLLMDPDVSTVTPRATYWLERAEALFPTNPVVFQLREHLLKSNLNGKHDNGQLEKLILSEISARPTDVTVRVRLINFFVDTKRYKLAYQHALEIEKRNIFSNDLRWYDCLCNVVQAYEKADNGLSFIFYIKKIIFFEKRADLSMQEFQTEVRTLPECSSALFAFDQCMHLASKIDVPQEETYFFSEFMKHMRAQLSFHLATLALKRAKKEYGIWPKAFRIASPLLLQATQTTMDLEGAWCNMWNSKNKMEREVKQLNRSSNFRASQAGHILNAWSQNKGSKFLEKVSQFCGGKWQNHVYQEVFHNREHQQATTTSHFINDPFFAHVPLRLLTDAELNYFDEVSQSAYPDSLHHLVWLGLAYCNAKGQLSHEFRCTTVPDLQFTVANLSQTGPESLNQLDVDAFLYASVLCANSAMSNNVSTDRPSRLPVSISEELCSLAQADWWVAVYKTYTNQTVENLADLRLKLRKGIEVIRVFGQHGLHVKIIVMLAKLFQERATKNKNPNYISGLEDRAHLYWTAAIPLLERAEKNQQLREVSNRLFNYRGKDLTPNEIKGYLEDGRLFLACRLMKQGRHEQAIEAFQLLKSPYATFYQALIYEKLASEEVNHRPESITSENRSQHIILLTRARDALYLTLDRLRCPSIDPNHPLNAQLQDHLDQIEKQLAMIDPDSTLNRNGDSQSDETDTAPGPLSPDVEENLESSFNVYNTSNFLNVKNHSASRTLPQNLSDKHHNPRFEARPSPERLDAQLRHLVQANSNGLQAIVEQLKEMRSTMQIELKDLGCVTRDLLAEMKRWNDRLESVSKRAADGLKPEDLFELREEDYEDISQLSQPYNPYPNYQVNKQITGTQGTSTVTYGTPVPSPIPPVLPVIRTPENPLIPPAFYPGAHAVPSMDPSLLYQSLAYYAPGMPYTESQSDYIGTGIQKGAPFSKTSFKVPDALPTTSLMNTKHQPPNVVITSSDTLPAFTSAGTPAMSVTVPPQHIRGLTPSSVALKSSSSQVHPFQIQMPPQAQLVKGSSTEKLNSLIPTTSFSTSPLQTALISGVKPTPVEQATAVKEMDQAMAAIQINKSQEKAALVQKLEESKLFESRGTLSVFSHQWKEQGVVLIKILRNDTLGKNRIYIVQEPSCNVVVDHYITPDIVIEPLINEYGWSWSATNMQKYRLKFNTVDESKDFEFAFNNGRLTSKENLNQQQKFTLSKNMIAKESEKNSIDKSCDNKEKSNNKTNLGGFTFTSSPIVKPPTLKLNEKKEKPKEQVKPSPFAEFSFQSATTTPNKPNLQTETTKPSLFFSQNNTSIGSSTNFFAGLKVDPNSFKKDANFKDFAGKDSPVFGYLNNPKTPSSKPPKPPKPSSKTAENEECEDEGEDFVPTAEFKPVVDLPDLVDVKTGEENDKVLYDERAKLLRFDTGLKEWKERGVGQMRVLLNEESGKVRLIMRRDLVLKVCCNHYLDEKMEFKRMTKSEKALTWYAQDYSEGEIKPELFALKFVNPTSLCRFETAVHNVQAKMTNGRVGDRKPKGITEEKPKELKPLSEMFKPDAGSWECGTCLLRNNKTAVKCVSCETPKPGTKTDTNSAAQSTGLGKGISIVPENTKFIFGLPQESKTIPLSTSTTKFTFGIPQNTTTSSNFTYGINSYTTGNLTTTTSSTATKFSFCIAQPSTTTSLFEFNKSTPNSSSAVTAPTFTFGIPKPADTSTSTTPVTTATSIFGGSVTAPKSTSNLWSAPKFTFSFSNTSSDKNEATNIFGKKTSDSDVSKSEENKSKVTSSGVQSIFTEGKEKFEFSLSSIKPLGTKITPLKTQSVSPKKVGEGAGSEESEEEAEEGGEEDSEDHIIVKPVVPLPDKVDLHTGEEDEDVFFEKRAKLFRFIDREWKERGIGDVKILRHRTNNKIRLLMRRETVLKVCLNHYVTPDIEFKPKSETTWTWTAPDFSEGEVRYEMFAIRFKTQEFAKEFKKILDDIKNHSLTLPSKVLAEKPQDPSEEMKNFTFAVPNPFKSELFKKSESGTADDDLQVVYENTVTPEQREKAISLHLPPNFYAYLQAPDCPGCLGCDKDDPPVQSQPNPQAVLTIHPPLTTNWGTLNLGNDEYSEEKVLSIFPGNPEGQKHNPISTVETITDNAEKENEDYEDDDEDEEYEEGNEDEEDEEDDEEENEEDNDDEGDYDKEEEDNEDNEGDEDEDEDEGEDEDEDEDEGEDEDEKE